MSSSFDFGTSVAPIKSGDAFFVDTNFVVSVTTQTHKFHDACAAFFFYLLFKNVTIKVSETVIQEALFILPKAMYANDKYLSLPQTERNLHTPNQRESIKRNFEYDFISFSKNPTQRHIVAPYSQRAWDLLDEFLQDESVEFVSSTLEICYEAADLSITKEMLSADAFILATAVESGSNGIISLDNDFPSDIVDKYKTGTPNEDFNIDIYSSFDYFEDLKEMINSEYVGS